MNKKKEFGILAIITAIICGMCWGGANVVNYAVVKAFGPSAEMLSIPQGKWVTYTPKPKEQSDFSFGVNLFVPGPQLLGLQVQREGIGIYHPIILCSQSNNEKRCTRLPKGSKTVCIQTMSGRTYGVLDPYRARPVDKKELASSCTKENTILDSPPSSPSPKKDTFV